MSGDVLGAADVLEATGVKEAGQYTAGCWLGCKGTFFATGHQTGSVCVWATPKLASSSTPPHDSSFTVAGRAPREMFRMDVNNLEQPQSLYP